MCMMQWESRQDLRLCISPTQTLHTALFCVACKARPIHSSIHVASRPKANKPTGSRPMLKAEEHHPQGKPDSSHLDAHIPHTHILLLGGALASIQDLILKKKSLDEASVTNFSPALQTPTTVCMFTNRDCRRQLMTITAVYFTQFPQKLH